MTKLDITNKVTRTFHKTKFIVKKNSPEILVITGIVGVVASAVMACKATTKLDDILDKAKEELDIIHEGADEEKLTETEYKKGLTLVYAKTGLEMTKLYGPSIALGMASIGCILSGNNIMRKRNAALAAAYGTLDYSFKNYRNNVIERFGEELDRELKHSIRTIEVKETVTDPETGKEKKVKKQVPVTGYDGHSEFARFFDDGCTGWEKDAEWNHKFLNLQQDFANKKLKEQGYLFLNDVYEMLGIPKTNAGFQVGWIYDEEHPNGDNYVDFGMYDIHNEKARDFVNGYERTILLDFNVDGVILNKIAF